MRWRYWCLVSLLCVVALVVSAAITQAGAKTLSLKIQKADAEAKDTVALQEELTGYARSHMWATSEVFLQGSHDRAVVAAQTAANARGSGSIYAQAQAACTKGASTVQAKCVQDYVATRTKPGQNPTEIATPIRADYTKAFPSPAFSFDSTGILIILALGSIIMTISSLILRRK